MREKASILDSEPRTDDVKITQDVTFESMLLPKIILNGLHRAGFKRPSPIQLCAIPLARCGLDLIVQAKSGTGKTLVFAITALESIKLQIKRPQVIILAPTREIAVQIKNVISTVGVTMKCLRVGCFIGGLPMDADRHNVNCHIIVGAPGRVRHLIEQNILDVKAVRLFVLDEADKILEQIFKNDVNYIYNNLGEAKQVLACSATFPPELLEFVNTYMKGSRHITPEHDPNSVLIGLKQFVYLTPDHIHPFVRLKHKEEALLKILNTTRFDQCVVFSNFLTRAESYCHVLKKAGWHVTCLTSKQSQEARIDAINSFKSHKIRILITTDLCSRGIDATNVNLVINVDCPRSAAIYLHRMGRAGRFGSLGLCISIISKDYGERLLRTILWQVGGSAMSVNIIPEDVKYFDLWKDQEYLQLEAKETYDSDTQLNPELNCSGSSDICSESDDEDSASTVSSSSVENSSWTNTTQSESCSDIVATLPTESSQDNPKCVKEGNEKPDILLIGQCSPVVEEENSTGRENCQEPGIHHCFSGSHKNVEMHKIFKFDSNLKAKSSEWMERLSQQISSYVESTRSFQY